ncbi:Transcription initiation factor TFIID subunit 6 [Nowakowskiella sp. JEL0407]|nr:Transcription initiation factor TFIID subunit 6 [Nowakowskiella sp. JEL0407]
MSIFSVDTVLHVAESAGITLKEDVANALLLDVEYRLRELIHESGKFMLHSRRKKLLPEDVANALKVRNVEPIYGYSAGTSAKYRSLPIGNGKMYFLEDKEIDLDEIINGPLPPVPVDVVRTAHWLAIEGVQPIIPQNPHPDELQAKLAASSTIRPASNMPPKQNDPITQTDEKSTVKNVLSKELQIFYDRITAALLSPHQESRKLAIESLQRDAGLQPLMPYFMQFLTEKVSSKLKNLPVLWTMCRTVKALFQNPNIFVEPYLHNFVPIIITCMISKRLSQHPTEDHWSLREFAAQLIAHIYIKFGSSYHTLQNRITKTLLRALLERQQGYGSNYGAIFGLSVLGDEVIRLLLEPNVVAFGESLVGDLQRMEVDDNVKLARKSDAQKCFDLVVRVMSQYIANTWSSLIPEGKGPISDKQMLRDKLDEQYGIFSEKLYERIYQICNE